MNTRSQLILLAISYLLSLIASPLLGACTQSSARVTLSGEPGFELTFGKVKGDLTSSVCQDFKLTEKQILYFFAHSRDVETYSFGKQYAWFPCSIRGKLQSKEITYSWQISPAGTAVLEDGEGQQRYLACDCTEECLVIFPEGGNVFYDQLPPYCADHP